MPWRSGWRVLAMGLASGLLFGSVQIAAARLSVTVDRLADLPLEISPAPAGQGGLVLFLSGDTGWGGLERSLARRLARAGIGVVGLDARRYFFTGRSPAELARDIERILAVYRRRWHAGRIALAGYSFGADALPFAWPLLSPRTRQETRLIALVGLLPEANFRISLLEMLDLPAADDVPVAPMLSQLPVRKVVCLYGREEHSACTLPELAGAERIARPGGHDRDGDAGAVVQAILRRLTVRPPVPPLPHRAAESPRG
ncbi:AcvB/VirJ family lysyl-phosphatidylglycerol hydrolase [Labrys neptuniae]|uniref:AcvB/VirJ family lysyl-phosphatidylglycerol hydrolase n=1 Tax=Labrys neptuniae TaxID=376174 RepID=UPI00288F51E7|nr:AcvB/VirJ family lysyl-phosphatidylglycerol hydrolase [Labrys neptuniae]MDT3379884.1 AcvB/VirJ family lysyl-phosphatidylglycerol hydrolase [Labrys neptuniae]